MTTQGQPKRKMSGVVVIYNDLEPIWGSSMTVYGRTDEFETEGDFLIAARIAADKHADDNCLMVQLAVSDIRKCLLRVNPSDPGMQEEFGARFFIAEVKKKGRGIWESWAAKVTWTSEGENVSDGL